MLINAINSRNIEFIQESIKTKVEKVLGHRIDGRRRILEEWKETENGLYGMGKEGARMGKRECESDRAELHGKRGKIGETD